MTLRFGEPIPDDDDDKVGPKQDEIAALRIEAGLTEHELIELSQMILAPHWKAFVKLLRWRQKQSDTALRNYQASVDLIRHHQGRVAALNELALDLSVVLPQWYEKKAPRREGQPA